MPPISPSPFWYRVKGSYFGECERDDEGHCLPSGESGAAKPEEGKKPPGLPGVEGSDGPGKVAETRKEERKVETEERRAEQVEHARNIARAQEEGKQEGQEEKKEITQRIVDKKEMEKWTSGHPFSEEEKTRGLEALAKIESAGEGYRHFDEKYDQIRLKSVGFAGPGKGFALPPENKLKKAEVVMEIDPSLIRYTQSSVIREAVAKKLSGEFFDPEFGATGLPYLIKDGNEYHLQGGNHRAVAQVLATGKVVGRVVEAKGKPGKRTFVTPQVAASPLRKRLSLFVTKDLSYLSETTGGALVPPPEQPPARGGTKDGLPERSALERAKHSDLITLPDGIEGTNCGNCEYWDAENGGYYCNHPEIRLSVTERMCCKYWDASGTYRAWEQNGKKSVDGFLTKGKGTCKPGERSDLTGCIPASGEASPRRPAASPEPTAPQRPQRAEEPERPSSGKTITFTSGADRAKAEEYAKQVAGEWAGGLSEEHRAAIEEYSSDRSYKALNAGLRADSPPEEYWGTIKSLDEAILSAPPIPDDIVLHRGVWGGVAKQLKVGTEFEDKGYTSCSLNRSVAEGFAEDAMIQIRVPAGARLMPMDATGEAKFQGADSENEWVFPRGTRFKVVEKKRDPDVGDLFVLEVVQ